MRPGDSFAAARAAAISGGAALIHILLIAIFAATN
jgi:hypothetical protein